MKRKEKEVSRESKVQTFKEILKLTQEQLHFYTLGQLHNYFNAEDIFSLDGGYIYVKGEIPVVLVAHFDTVHKIAPTDNTMFHDLEKNVIWSIDGIGGDDRCGVFSILDILSQGYRPHVMFTWDEEIGCVGSTEMANTLVDYFGDKVEEGLSEINFAIQLDRQGFGEAVYYNLDNIEFENYISKFGFKTEWGSYTDICKICPEFKFAGVNVSAGYINEHSNRELIFVDEVFSTQSKIIEILVDQIVSPEFFEYKEGYSYLGYGSYDYGDGWGNTYSDDETYDYGSSWGKGSDYYNSDNYDTSKPKAYVDTMNYGEEEEEETEVVVEKKVCQYCLLEKNSVPWSESENKVLNELCDECKSVYLMEVEK